ncbi:MAG: cadmium-translocating P-type ATPase [candidate division Zixibacteria bacterium]|nr:cadmium-translocating P-type ATPase [candidate division Zixibacteria bacterium]
MADKTTRECKLNIDGLDCPDCARKLETGLKDLKGVKNARVNLVSKTINIDYSSDTVNADFLVKNIEGYGYSARYRTPETSEDKRKTFNAIPTIISGIAAVAGILLDYLGSASYFYIGAFVTAIISGGYKVAYKGFKAALKLSLDMNFLMSIAVIGAIILGEWSEGAMVIFLFSLSLLLENRSMNRARSAIEKLMDLTPKTANVIDNGSEKHVPVESVQIGQNLLIRPGESIPLDGTVIDGTSSVNQSPVTGESVPVIKQESERLFAGSINGEGALTMRVDALYENSTVARIIQMVEEAQSRRAPVQLFVDRFAKYYTPLVVIGAVLIAAIPPLLFAAEFSEWFYRALVLLIIACPCALVISTPVSFVSGLTSAARDGLLIKGGVFLERASGVSILALDKTGTITYGEPRVVEVISAGGLDETGIVSIAASLERYSEHPVAAAIVAESEKRAGTLREVEGFSAIPGSGVAGLVEGVKYYAANHTFFEEKGLCDPQFHRKLEGIENSRRTAVLLGTDDEIEGVIAVADSIRSEARTAIEKLRSENIKEITVISGDNHNTTEAVASEIGADSYYSDLHPENKLDIIRKLKKEGLTAMVGDGINDAPALAEADLGIAMGSGGTDAALESADIAIVGDDLNKLPRLFHLSRRTMNIIKQNIALALGIKAVFAILTVLGWATLWMAVFADMGASLIVISNSLRLLRGNH